MDVGAPGSESDAAIFSNCAFSRLMENKLLNIPEDGILDGQKTPYVIVGDEAFPLKPWLMRPFPGRELDDRKDIFNYRLSRARRVVENTFGIWAAKWQILYKPIDADKDLVHLIIWSTLILHNYLRVKLQEEIRDEDELCANKSNIQSLPRMGSNNYTMNAFQVREKFADYFLSPSGSLPWQYQHIKRK